MSEVSERTQQWFGERTRDELLAEIDRIITTDKPALSGLYEELDRLRDLLVRIYDNKRVWRVLPTSIASDLFAEVALWRPSETSEPKQAAPKPERKD